MSDRKKDPRDDYGPPLEDPKLQKAITAKQALLQGSASRSLQNRYTPITPYQVITPRAVTPLALPSASSSTNLVQLAKTPFHYTQLARPSITSQQIEETFTPVQTKKSKNKEKIPYYTPPADTPPCPFIPKAYQIPIFTLEPEYLQGNSSLLQVITKFFPEGFHFYPRTLEHDRRFYEFILIDTGSIEITHNKEDPNDPQKITYSKFKITRVISPREWGVHPSIHKSFTRKFVPQTFNYIHYMEAWYSMLYLEPYNHSWFIWFKKDIPLKFPQWFIWWFIDTGADTSIFPDFALTAFNRFIEETTFPPPMQTLAFCASFGITWITSWNYRTQKVWEGCDTSQVFREFKIKWWIKFNPYFVSNKFLDQWFREHPSYLKKVKQDDTEVLFLAEKSKIMAELSSSSNKEEFLKKLHMAMSGDNAEDKESEAGSSQNYAPMNEDDCYGIEGIPEIP